MGIRKLEAKPIEGRSLKFHGIASVWLEVTAPINSDHVDFHMCSIDLYNQVMIGVVARIGARAYQMLELYFLALVGF